MGRTNAAKGQAPPSPEEDLAYAERVQAANRSAFEISWRAFRDLRQEVAKYKSHPATGGGKALIADIPLEIAEATRRFPGLGGASTSGMLSSVIELGSAVITALGEEAEQRLHAIPPVERKERRVCLVFGAPGSGKTTFIEALADIPEVVLAIEAVGGDTAYLLRQADRYLRKGFQVSLVLVTAPLEIAVRRSVQRAFWAYRVVHPIDLVRLYRQAMAAPARLLEELAKFPSDRRPELALLDNGGPMGAATYNLIRQIEDLNGFTDELDRCASGEPLNEQNLTETALRAALDQLGAHLDRTEPVHPDLVRIYASGFGDQAGPFWAIWRRSLLNSMGPTGSPEPSEGAPEARADQGTGPGTGTVKPVPADAPMDLDRAHDLYEFLLQIAKDGVQAEPIAEILRRKLIRGEVSLADLQVGFDNALAETAGQRIGAILATARRRLITV